MTIQEIEEILKKSMVISEINYWVEMGQWEIIVGDNEYEYYSKSEDLKKTIQDIINIYS